MRPANVLPYRLTAVLLTLTGIFALVGCGADRHGSGSCRRDQVLAAAGTPVQSRAMAVFRSAWLNECPDRVFSFLPADPADALSRFTSGEVDIVATHSPLTPEDHQRLAKRCDDSPALQLPMVLRGITLPYNLPGVGNLVLTRRLIAKIFDGEIGNWSDPQIVAVNGGVPLPDLPVTPVVPAEDSVLNEDFSAYVRHSNGEVPAPPALQVRNAAAAVEAVVQTPGAITYTTIAAPQLPSVLIDSGQGPVAFTVESAMQAIDAAEFLEAGDDLALAMDTVYGTREPGGYPLVGVSYDVVCSKGYDARSLTAVGSFLETAAQLDPAAVTDAGYLPLPPFLRDRIVDVVDSLE